VKTPTLPRLAATAAALAGGVLASRAAHAQTVVAGGDVTADSAVLLLKADATGAATIEYSIDPAFGPGTVAVPLTIADVLVPAKTTIDGLLPATEYFVRATPPAGAIAETRFRTLDPTLARGPVRIATLTDWQQSPPFTSVRNVPLRNPDVVLKLGDTIYADTETRALPGIVQARTLTDFRIKHDEIISTAFGIPGDDFMSSVYASAPIFNTIDDHELVDNFAGGALPGESPDAGDINPGEPPLFTDPVPFVNRTQAYLDAMQAYREHHPMADTFWSGTGDPRMDGVTKLYRHRVLNGSASITMLDSRSFRDVQLPPVANPLDPAEIAAFLASTFTPGRTLLGSAQLDRLKADLLADQAAGVTWKLVVIPEPIQNFGFLNAEDRFEGYAAERTELLAFIDQAGIDNVVFVAGDFHGTIVNDLSYQLPAPGFPSVPIRAFEVVTGPVAFFEGRFGPAVANIAFAAGFISPAEFAFYESLDVAGQDAFIRQLVDAQITPLGYSPIGLEDAPRIDAELLQGSYFAAHGFSWTEFDIDDEERLTVTTWSIPAFSDADAEADPAAVLALEPQVVSQFRVNPFVASPADLDGDGVVDMADLQLLLADWGPCPAGGDCPADLDGDGTVSYDDLLQLLASWTVAG